MIARRICVALVALGLAGCGRSMCDIPKAPTTNAGAGQPEAAPADIQILDFGPHSATAGVPFNRQPDGRSAIWFKLDQNVEGSLVNVRVGDKVLSGDIAGDVVTLKVPDDVHAEAGAVVLSLDRVDGQKVRRSNVVTLVLEKP